MLHSFPLPPSNFWWVFNCCFVIGGDLIVLLLHRDECDDCFFCLLLVQLLYCLHVRAAWYGSFCTPGVQYRCTILGVSLPFCVHVRAAWYGSFNAPGVATAPLAPCLVSHYRLVCMYTLHAGTVLSVHLYHAGTTMWRSPVHIHGGVTFHCFAESTLITPFLKLPFLPSSSLASLSTTVSLSLLVSGQLLTALSLLVIWWLSFCCTLMNLVIAYLAHCLCITTVSYVCTGWTVR